jgi:hypothetical protein
MSALSFRHGLRDTLFSSRTFSRTFLLLAALHGLLYWLLSAWLHPGEPWSVAVLYRTDYTYFPWIRALADGHFQPAFVLDPDGPIQANFPFFSLGFYGLLVHLFSWFGFMLADVLLITGFYVLLAAGLKMTGLPSLASEAISLAVICEMPCALLESLTRLSQAPPWTLLLAFLVLFGLAVALRGQAQLFLDRKTNLGKTFYLTGVICFFFIWGFYTDWKPRLIRPLLSEFAFWGWLLIILRALSSPRLPDRKHAFLFGLSLGYLLQNDFHVTLACLLSLPGFFILLGLKHSWKKALLWLIPAGGGFLIAAFPFLLARWHENPETALRYGIFPISRFALPSFEGPYRMLYFLNAALGAGFLGVAQILKKTRHSSVIPFIYFAVILATMGVFALPLSVLVLGKSVQIYYFLERVWKTAFYSGLLIFAIGWIRLYSNSSAAKFPPAFRLRLAGLFFLAAFSSSVWVNYGRASVSQPAMPFWVETPHPELYRQQFSELVRELEKPAYASNRVLGTWDHQVSTWWLVSRGGAVLNPDGFISPLSSQEMETRLILAGHLLGLSPDDFIYWLENPTTNICWLGCDKYQATSGYTFRPLAEYSIHQQDRIRRVSIFSSWHVLLPVTEGDRLKKAYQTQPPMTKIPPDLIILHRDSWLARFSPVPRDYVLVFQNAGFSCYQKRAGTSVNP